MFPNYNEIKIDFWQEKKDLWDFPNILTINSTDLNNSWVKNKTHGNSECLNRWQQRNNVLRFVQMQGIKMSV